MIVFMLVGLRGDLVSDANYHNMLYFKALLFDKAIL